MALINLLQSQRRAFRAASSPRQRKRANTKCLRLEPIEDRRLPSGFSTYLGGSLGDEATGIAVDAAGNSYVIGNTSSADSPATVGSYDPSYNGGGDVFVAKFAPDGVLAWATYLGGSSGDQGVAAAVDGSGDVYVTGVTFSADFPTTAGAFDQTANGGFNGFVAKFNGTSGALVYATYLGGSLNDQPRVIAVDGSGNAYVTGGTSSTDFPTTAGAFQTTSGGGTKSFVTKLNATGSALDYSTYLRGSGDYAFGTGLAIDGSGNAYLAGTTNSTDFPTTTGAFQTAYGGGGYDGFVAKLNGTGSALDYCTYLGGSGDDFSGFGIAVDASGNAYVIQTTYSADFPTTAGAFQQMLNGSTDVTVTKLNAAGSALVYSTYLGGADSDWGSGIVLDAAGNACVTGNLSSTDFPTTADAFQTGNGGGLDGFLTKLMADGTALVYSTYLGGSGTDASNFVAADGAGNVYVAGITDSTNFPTTAGAFDTTANGGYDAFVTKFNLGGGADPVPVTIDQAIGQIDPTAGPTISFDVVFAAPVTDFDAADIDFTGSAVGGTLVADVTGTGAAYTVTVTGMTGAGTIVASIPAGAAAGPGGVSTLASTSTDNTVTFDGLAPAVTVDQAAGQADPTTVAPITFTVHFSEVVTSFDGSDISFAGSTVGGTLVAGVTGSGDDYTVTVTGMTGQGSVVASIPAGAAADAAGNGSSASTSTDNTVTYDVVPPSLTINQAVGQLDPTNVASIQFDVTFSEPVTGFDPADVSLAGSTAGGTLAIDVTGALDTYMVTVTGMTTRGLVVATIPAGGATDLAGNASLASTSTDNAVKFLNTGTVGFTQAVYATTEDDGIHTVTITVIRAGQTEGAVSIQYGTSPGTAHAGTDYTTTSGTLSWADGEGGDKTFDIPILPDTLNEGKELINLALTNPVGSPGLGLVDANVAIAPSDGQGPGTYLDQDGDKVTIRLLGKTGSLLWFRTDPDGDGKGPIELIELAGTLPDPLKPKASLVISVAKARTSVDGGTVGLGAITGSGLRGISARKANLNLEGINLNGYLESLTIGNIVNGADVTTRATANPLQKTRINALAIGDGTAIDVGAHMSSLTVASFGAGSVTAPSVGGMIIRGPMAADVTVTGVGVEPTRKALGVLRVKRAVTGSDLMVTGNVGTVSVGAFRDSRLFAGYTGPDDGTGRFNFPASVTAFRVTGKVDGFQNSRVIATAFKSVTLASVDSTNPSNSFGFYADVSLGAITVTGPTKWKYNPALPTPQGLDDFEVRIV